MGLMRLGGEILNENLKQSKGSKSEKFRGTQMECWLNIDSNLFENGVFEDWVRVSFQGNVLEIEHSHFCREFSDFIVFQVENLETPQLEDVSVDDRDFVI